MSSRRKSSVPSMVRVSSDPLDQQEDLKEGMEVEALEDSDSSAETSEASQQTPPEGPGQQNLPNQVGDPHPEQDEQEPPPVLEDAEGEAEDSEGFVSGSASQKKSRSFQCKYCPFSTPNLSLFKEHVDSSHPNVILNPLYLCTVCNFNTNKFDSLTEHNESQHPGETNFKFKRLKVKRQTVLEQTIEAQDASAEGDESTGDISAAALFSAAVKTPDGVQPLHKRREVSQLEQLMRKEQITAVNINGTVIIPEATILQGLSHVSPLLQRPPNFHSVPKIAVPLNTAKYNPSLDRNATLITSFNKFPYPTHAELSWLTAASKHPEEQIKVWFTTQRLKQGITWSPEEVEEARKKMFNGSVPPAHHTFTLLPTGPSPQAAPKVSQQPLLYASVRQSSQARATPANGPTLALNGGTSGPAHKRAHPTAIFGPEPKRPVLAVAPHSGDDKMLMAPPPPPPPPQKERLPMAPPPVPMEMKRAAALAASSAEVKRPPAAVPLVPSAPSSSKGKLPPVLGNAKTKPVVSLPSIMFPESLTTPMIAPPPFAAPLFKNSLLIPFSSAIASKDKHPHTHAAEAKLPASPPLSAPQMRRPPIIQAVRPPPKPPAHIPAFPPEGKFGEPRGMEAKAGSSRREAGPAAEANGTSDCKWPQDLASPAPNRRLLEGGVPPAADLQHKCSVLTQFPLLERMKGKTGEQLKVLEEYFLRNSFPAQSDLDNLAAATQLSHQEISSWFLERRALRDNLEQALLNSMGAKRMGAGALSAITKKMNQQLNGIHKAGAGTKAPPPHALPPGAPGPSTPSVANSKPCSVPPDSQPGTLLQDSLAQKPWPSPEELSQLDCRTGPAPSDLACWFNDGHLHGGGVDMAEHFHKHAVNGGQGPPPSENALPALVRRCQEGGVANSSSRKMLEAEFGRLMERRANSFSSQVRDDLQHQFTDR